MIADAGTLLRLFNLHVDFVRYDGTKIVAVPKDKASHRLVCTRWNSDKELSKHLKKRIREAKTRPSGYALAVCAMPLRQRNERTTLRLVTPIAEGKLPVYDRNGGLTGKRKVLCAIVDHADHPHKLRRLIKTLPNDKCDSMYRNLLRANRVARRKFKKLQRKLNRRAVA